MDKTFDRDRLSKLSEEIIKTARTQVLARFRFMDLAVFKLIYKEDEKATFGTDGKYLYASPKHVAVLFKDHGGLPAVCRMLLHSVFHSVFLHQWVGAVDKRVWNLSADIASEAMVFSLIGTEKNFALDGDEKKGKVIKEMAAELGAAVTAERLYYYFLKIPGKATKELEELFVMDEHPWYPDSAKSSPVVAIISGGLSSPGTSGSTASVSTPGTTSTSSPAPMSEEEKEAWEKIAASLAADLESWHKGQGDGAGGLVSALKDLTRERYDYADFLRRFCTLKEMRGDSQELDRTLYSYGLQMYGNIPLVEQMEYTEKYAIDDIVIAIDSSGSTFGDLAQTFLKKTYNILYDEAFESKKFNLHIIQADAAVQEDVVIRSQEEFRDLIQRFTIKGGGGTDFRPVFEYVDQLCKEGVFTHLKGLIYFTDGYGTFPQKPNYQTAFVFVEKSDAVVPAWAFRLNLSAQEIEEI